MIKLITKLLMKYLALLLLSGCVHSQYKYTPPETSFSAGQCIGYRICTVITNSKGEVTDWPVCIVTKNIVYRILEVNRKEYKLLEKTSLGLHIKTDDAERMDPLYERIPCGDL